MSSFVIQSIAINGVSSVSSQGSTLGLSEVGVSLTIFEPQFAPPPPPH